MEEKILITGGNTSLSLKFKKYAICFTSIFFIALFMAITSERVDLYFIGLISCIISAPVSIITFLLHIWMSKCEITVTDKRVYGTCIFKTRVDLPIDAISAVGTSMLNGIAIGTSSGRLKFYLIANNVEIHSCISKLLVDRQKNLNTCSDNDSIKKSDSADEIKKYKELLDIGAITPEEFEIKKKELLGL